jgi:hypothetical protein
MIRFDLDAPLDGETTADESEVDLRHLAVGMVAETDGEISASASASGE